MSLQEKLEELKKKTAAVIPPEAMAVMDRATDDLRNSGIMDTVLKPGEKAPKFSLQSPQAGMIHSAELLKKGPIVIGFYRGIW